MRLYTISEYKLTEESSMRVLSRDGKPSFIEELARSPKTRRRASLIARTADRIERFGIDWAFESTTLKWVSADISLCEMRVSGKVIRVMTYLTPGTTSPIYLFDFDGHQGKGGSIPPHLLRKAEQLAQEARSCLERNTNYDR